MTLDVVRDKVEVRHKVRIIVEVKRSDLRRFPLQQLAAEVARRAIRSRRLRLEHMYDIQEQTRGGAPSWGTGKIPEGRGRSLGSTGGGRHSWDNIGATRVGISCGMGGDGRRLIGEVQQRGPTPQWNIVGVGE